MKQPFKTHPHRFVFKKTAWHEALETQPPMGSFMKKKEKRFKERDGEKNTEEKRKNEKHDLFSMFTVYFFPGQQIHF